MNTARTHTPPKKSQHEVS